MLITVVKTGCRKLNENNEDSTSALSFEDVLPYDSNARSSMLEPVVPLRPCMP